jgi:hypothetical protein
VNKGQPLINQVIIKLFGLQNSPLLLHES